MPIRGFYRVLFYFYAKQRYVHESGENFRVELTFRPYKDDRLSELLVRKYFASIVNYELLCRRKPVPPLYVPYN